MRRPEKNTILTKPAYDLDKRAVPSYRLLTREEKAMSKRLLISSGRIRKAGAVLAVLSCLGGVLLVGSRALAAAPQDQRQLGEEVLLEALLGSRQLMVRVATGGCTDKDSFKPEVYKMPGTSLHYVLTLNRIKPDNCKALFPDGTPVLFDLEKDFGLSGVFSYSLANKVRSAPGAGASQDSFFGIVKKYFTAKNPS
jgi:hypothetical protein